MNLPDFDYMFALRLEYTDVYNDEYIIIQELKKILLDIINDNNTVNEHLINFYKEYNIDIDISALTPEITEEKNDVYYESGFNNMIAISYPPQNMNEFLQNIENEPQLQNIYNNINMINMIYDMINMIQPPELTDVATPLDETEYTKIKNYVLETKHDDNCSICLCELDKDEKVSSLPCSHLYHEECIMSYLKDYHRICPVCRTEVGKRKDTNI